jgi:hypothetical protein
VLGLPGSVARRQDDAAERLVVDPSDVILEPAVVATRANVVELLRFATALALGGDVGTAQGKATVALEVTPRARDLRADTRVPRNDQ